MRTTRAAGRGGEVPACAGTAIGRGWHLQPVCGGPSLLEPSPSGLLPGIGVRGRLCTGITRGGGTPRPGTAPLGCWLRGNDESGGGPSRLLASQGCPARAQPLWIPAFAGMTMRGDGPSGLLASQGYPAWAQPLWIPACAGMTRVGTAPLGCWIRGNDARGGGQERWGEGVRFQPTRAREEVSRPPLIHVWISQKGERGLGEDRDLVVIAHHPAPWARWHPSTFALRSFRLSKRWAAGTWRPTRGNQKR